MLSVTSKQAATVLVSVKDIDVYVFPQKEKSQKCRKKLIKLKKKVTNNTEKVTNNIDSLLCALFSNTGVLRMAGALEKSTDVMRTMQQLVKVPEIQATMQEMSKEMMKVHCAVHVYFI